MSNIKIENCKLIFRNFSGEESAYNSAGDRNFCVIIDDQETATELLEDGWNLKLLNKGEGYEDEEDRYYLPVKVSYKVVAPRVNMIIGNKMVSLDEDTIGNLDHMDIESADVIINPYRWEVNKKSGIKAYLKTAYVNIAEDDFADKYRGLSNGEDDE